MAKVKGMAKSLKRQRFGRSAGAAVALSRAAARSAGRGDAAEEGDGSAPEVDSYRAQHLSLARCEVVDETGPVAVTVDESESPLGWLARRKGRDGAALISAVQLQAGERLRADFTYANLMPRTTSKWDAAVSTDRRSGGGAGAMTDTIVAARQRVQLALAAVGPEFSGVLLDVCCFLKGLEDIERERCWPARSAKVVLQLGLDSLARHYGYRGEIRGSARAKLRAWSVAWGAGEAGAVTPPRQERSGHPT
jgi:hypothetical protein